MFFWWWHGLVIRFRIRKYQWWWRWIAWWRQDGNLKLCSFRVGQHGPLPKFNPPNRFWWFWFLFHQCDIRIKTWLCQYRRQKCWNSSLSQIAGNVSSKWIEEELLIDVVGERGGGPWDLSMMPSGSGSLRFLCFSTTFPMIAVRVLLFGFFYSRSILVVQK